MSTHAWWTMACDFRLTERCLTLRGTAPPGGPTSAEARLAAKSVGWKVSRQSLDICPGCWPDRAIYHAGRLVSGIPIA